MLRYLLSDLNGRVWDFTPACPVRLAYVRGIDGANFTHDTLAGAGQRGVTVMGTDYGPGAIELGVRVQPGRLGILGAAAVDIASRWRDGIGEGEAERDGRQMRFTVAATGRFQAVRLLKKGPFNWEKVRHSGLFTDEIVLQSDDSDWHSNPITSTFTAAQFATAKVYNHGTVPSWPGFKLHGPITNPRVGLGDESVLLPNLTAGQWIEIDTDPRWYSVLNDSGDDLSWSLTTLAGVGQDDRWRTKAAPRSVPIPVTITGTDTTEDTKLEVTVPQIHRSAR